MGYNKKEIMKEAHRKYKNELCYKSLSEALKQSWFEAKYDEWYRERYLTQDDWYEKDGYYA